MSWQLTSGTRLAKKLTSRSPRLPNTCFQEPRRTDAEDSRRQKNKRGERDMSRSSVFTERGWTEARNYRKRVWRYLIASAALGLVSSVATTWFYTLPHLRPLQQLYLMRYGRATVLSKLPIRISTTYLLLVRTVVDNT